MARDYDKDIDNIQYGKTFAKDPKFSEILSDTSIDSKVTMSHVHKNINSLSGQLEKSQLDFHKQIKGISGSISSTVKQQEKLVKQIQMRELSSSREVKVVEKSVQQIMGKLGYTIDILGKSSKKILVDTARTTKETLKQYGQALSADFNINKSNFLAMSLAKASPIFGYFVGKFMETGIFKHFSELIKEKLGMAVTFVGNKIKDLWGRGTTKVKTWYNKRKESKQNQKELPKLQTGGYVTKAGAAKLHAAEVVAPVEKLRDMFTEALQPVTDTVRKIYSFMKWSAVFKMAKNVYRFFRRGKYSSYLSKTKDAQVKLVEDFGTFFNQSMLRYDEMIAALKGKGKKDTDFETWQEEIAAAALKQQNNEKKFSMKEFFSEDNIKKFFSKETAKTFTDEFGKAFKAELKKPENMFNKVKEKIGDERINKTKDWIKDLKNIITGKEVLTVSKTERLKEKLGYNRAKEKGKEYYQFGKDKYNEEGIPLYESYKTKLKEGYNKFQKSEGVTKTKKFIHDKITGVSAEGIHDAFIAVFRGVNKVLMAPLKILNKTMSILVRSTIMLGRGISKLTFGIWRIVKWTAGLPFRLLFSTVKTLTKVVTSIPNAFMSATTSIFNKMTNFMKKGGFSGAAKRFGGTMKTLFIGADKQPESEVLAGDTGAATITEINKKEKKKKGLEGELQKIRHSITEFHGSVSKDWAKDTEISKKQSETVKKSWKGMIEQFKTSRDGMKNQLNTLKESYKTFKEQKNLQKKIKNATEGTESKLGLGQSALKKAFSSIGTWLMIGVTLLKSAFGNIIGMVKGLLSKIPFLKKLFPNLGGPGGVGGSKGGLFSKAKKSGKFKYGGTGVKAGGIAGRGMGAGMSTLGGGIAGVMSGIEVGKERGMASGIAQGAISGSLSTVGGLLLGPIGTVLGKMLGDAIGKAAFGLGDWMAKHFNIFEIVDRTILTPIQNIFRTIGNIISDIKNGIVSAISSVLPDWAKKLIGITDTKPQTDGDRIREQMKRDPEAAFKEAQFQAAKRSKVNREAGGDELNQRKPISIAEMMQSFLLSRRQDDISDSSNGTMTTPFAPAPGQKSISQRMVAFASNIGEKIASVFNGSGALPTDSSVVTSEFGPRNTGLVGASTFHKGIDLRAPMGSPIYAMQQGTVSGINDKWGKVILKHPNNYTSEYAHLSEFGVKPGDIVQKGQRIGSAGKTGPIPGMAPHLHHTIKAPDGTAINPRSFYEQIGIDLQRKGGNQISNREVGGPNLNMKHVAKMQADKDMTTANLFNESTKGIQNSLQDSMNHSGKQTAVIINSMTNSISSSMNSLAKSVSGGGGGSNQGNDEISAILSGRMQ